MSAFSITRPRNDDTAQRLLWKIASYQAAEAGLAGVERVADTAAHAGSFSAFHAITDCVVAAVAGVTGLAAGDTLKTGDWVRGSITSLTLTSGTGELYKSVL
jgi:hypothetical protein